MDVNWISVFKNILSLAEGVTGKDLVDDQKVNEAFGKILEAIAAFNEVVKDIKSKQAPAE